MYTIPYILIRERLKAMLPELKTVTAYTGQDQSTDKQGNPLYQTPAALIELMPVDMIQKGNKVQGTRMVFRLHLITKNVQCDDKRVTGDEHAVDHFGLVDKIHKHLSHYAADLSGVPGLVVPPGADRRVLNTIRRTNITPDNTLKRLMKTIITYDSYVNDYSAVIDTEGLEDVDLTQTIEVTL